MSVAKAEYMAAYYQRTKHLQLAPSYLIYKITNIVNGKFYIGITKKLLKLRLKGHENSAAQGRKGKFMTAIRKHGIELFKIEQLDTAKDLREANEMEIYYIATLKPNYNCTKGGDGTKGFANPKTQKWKKQMSELRKELWRDPISRYKMAMGRVNAGNPMPKSIESGAIHAGRDKYWTAEKKNLRTEICVKSKALVYKVKCPDGKIVEVENLALFCKKVGIDNANLNKTAPGRVFQNTTHKGYKLLEKGKRKFVSINSVASFLKISRTAARNLRNLNPVMFLETVQKMKDRKIISAETPALPVDPA
jgi:group I intron endonuclease